MNHVFRNYDITCKSGNAYCTVYVVNVHVYFYFYHGICVTYEMLKNQDLPTMKRDISVTCTCFLCPVYLWVCVLIRLLGIDSLCSL